MINVRMRLPSQLQRPGPRTAISREPSSALHTCLVVTRSQRLAGQLSQAAQEEHWSTVVCHNAAEARRQRARQRFQLALVDLQAAADKADDFEELLRLVEHLAEDRMLLAVFGSEADSPTEVWSRQLGVWTYLAGVEVESDLTWVFAEARQALAKKSNPNAAVSP